MGTDDAEVLRFRLLHLQMIAVLISASLLASTNVGVRLTWPDAGTPHPSVTIHAQPVDAGGAKEIDFAATSDATTIALPAGQWFVTAKAAGFWSEPRLIATSDSDIVLALEPATRMRARVKLPRPVKASEMTVYLQTSDVSMRARSVVCPIIGDRAECDVPAGKQDLVFRVPGCSSIFRWSEDLKGSQSDLGTLVFRRGSTFSGRVEATTNEKINVILAPSSEANENEMFRVRKNAARMVTQPNARGFFSFNVAPGHYFVHATAGDLVSAEEEVMVIEGREAVLRDVLRLESRRALRINIDPPIDPWNKPWKVSLARRNADGVIVSEQMAVAPSDGRVQFIRQVPGSYSLSIHRGDVDEWASAQVELQADTTLDIAIPMTRVRGSVELAGQPLAALITFRDDKGMRLPVRSKNDGTFLTLLPKIAGDTWPRIEIE